MQRVQDLVMSRAGHLPAVRLVEAEAASSAAESRGPQVRAETTTAAARALDDIARQDQAFAAQLRQLIEALPKAGNRTGTVYGSRVTQASDHAQVAQASGHGRVSQASGIRAIGPVVLGDKSTTVYKRGAGILGILLILAVLGAIALHYVPNYLYQRRVVAACDQMRDITSENHQEILQLGVDPANPTGGGTPTDLFRVNKGVLIQVLNDRLARVTSVYDGLTREDTPGSLTTRKTAADRAFADWSRASQDDIATLQAKVRDNATLTALQQVINATATFGNGLPGTRLNAAMTSLAGRTCTATSPANVQQSK